MCQSPDCTESDKVHRPSVAIGAQSAQYFDRAGEAAGNKHSCK